MLTLTPHSTLKEFFSSTASFCHAKSNQTQSQPDRLGRRNRNRRRPNAPSTLSQRTNLPITNPPSSSLGPNRHQRNARNTNGRGVKLLNAKSGTVSSCESNGESPRRKESVSLAPNQLCLAGSVARNAPKKTGKATGSPRPPEEQGKKRSRPLILALPADPPDRSVVCKSGGPRKKEHNPKPVPMQN